MNKTNDNNLNFYIIHEWMTEELKLKSNELNIYALIYSFSKNDNRGFYGSLGYLCSRAGGIKEQTARNLLKALKSKGYIVEREILKNGIKCYAADLERVKNFEGTPQKICPNNKRDNKDNNKVINSAAGKKAKGLSIERSYSLEEFERQANEPPVYVPQKERAAQENEQPQQ